MSDSSDRMRLIRRFDTAPELRVRKELWRRGLRYRLHPQNLPGTPDIVFSKAKVAVFVHGCFWHRHPGCKLASMPKTNQEFWRSKFRRNVERDFRKADELRSSGWHVAIVWQCEAESSDVLLERSDAIEQAVLCRQSVQVSR